MFFLWRKTLSNFYIHWKYSTDYIAILKCLIVEGVEINGGGLEILEEFNKQGGSNNLGG